MTQTLTILLLPGLLCDATIWRAQQTALARFAPIVIPDFSTHSSLIEMAQSALDQTTGPLIVIGHSMGARAAFQLVRLAPDRVLKLAVLDTGVHPPQPGEAEKRQILVDLAYQQGMEALADTWLPPMVDQRRRDDRALMDPLKSMVLRATPDQHARQIKALINRPDARPLLPAIKCPTLVLVGRQDQWSPLPQHEEIAALIPGAKLGIIEDSGHMTPVEQPEATTAALITGLGLGF